MERICVIYASVACSEGVFEKFFSESAVIPGQAVQKFNRLLIEGLSKPDGVKVCAISQIPVDSHNCHYKRIKRSTETEGNVSYEYIKLINIRKIRDILAVFSSYRATIGRIRAVSKSEKALVISDVLNAPVALGAAWAAKRSHIPYVAVVTDIPELGGSGLFYRMVSDHLIKRADLYVFLTEQMNSLLNHDSRPFTVVEGFVDIEEGDGGGCSEEGSGRRVCLYTGALDPKFGTDNMVIGFLKADIKDTQLHICGEGPYADEYKRLCDTHDNLFYHGLVLNKEAVKMQRNATLLINPRPTDAEYTKYSFPSKNMEYMVSGTPVLTSDLPGMPKEYRDHVYIIKDTSVEGIAEALKEVLSLPEADLKDKGNKAREFVLSHKNNVIQAERILNMVKRYWN